MYCLVIVVKFYFFNDLQLTSHAMIVACALNNSCSIEKWKLLDLFLQPINWNLWDWDVDSLKSTPFNVFSLSDQLSRRFKATINPSKFLSISSRLLLLSQTASIPLLVKDYKNSNNKKKLPPIDYLYLGQKSFKNSLVLR